MTTSRDRSAVLAVLNLWPVAADRKVGRAPLGTNNSSYLVETPSGSYYLRLYEDTDDGRRIGYEHRILLALGASSLPFAVPQPLATYHGETVATLVADGITTTAALFPAIPGDHPERGNLLHRERSGAALGQLDVYLAQLEMEPKDGVLGFHADLDTLHPQVPDPVGMIQGLPVGKGQKRKLEELFQQLPESLPRFYQDLPRQLIHADYVVLNTLFDGDVVSGILDFEFASPDVLVMDFVVGLLSFGSIGREQAATWPAIAAFARGYATVQPLAESEIAAIPTLLRLRRAVTLVRRVGRLRQGKATEAHVHRLAVELLATDQWLRRNGDRLVEQIASTGERR